MPPGIVTLSVLITILFGVLGSIVLSLLLGQEEGHDSKSTSTISMTVALFAATMSLVGFGISIHRIFKDPPDLLTNIGFSLLSACMAAFLCAFVADVVSKWHADPDMWGWVLFIIIGLSVCTLALLVTFLVVCFGKKKSSALDDNTDQENELEYHPPLGSTPRQSPPARDASPWSMSPRRPPSTSCSVMLVRWRTW